MEKHMTISETASGAQIEYSDDGPDKLGRRRFTLTWADEGGIYRPELHPDGDPVGYRRAQCFFCDPARFEAAPVIAECSLHERLRAAIEVEQVVRFWGGKYTITPLLVPVVFGDGLSLIHITPLASRPDYFVVRGDSGWIDEHGSWASVNDTIYTVLEEGEWRCVDPKFKYMECGGGGIYEAIEEAFGRWYDEENRDPEDTDEDYQWPVVDLGFGTGWGCVRVDTDSPWGRMPPEWLSTPENAEKPPVPKQNRA